MSSALANASRLKADIRLSQAILQFQADLSPEQKTRFSAFKSQACSRPPDVGDVMRLTAEIDRQTVDKAGRRRCFGPRLTNILEAVQQFAALGDIVVGGSQNIIACSVWSAVRLSLLVGVSSSHRSGFTDTSTQSMAYFSSYIEKLSTLFMIVGRSAPRYSMMALLYPQSRKLQSDLFEYFIIITRLCHMVLKFTQKSTLGKFVSSLDDSELNYFQSQLDIWANSIKEEVSLLNVKKENEERLSILKKSAGVSKVQQKLHRKQQVLDCCSKYDHETTWKQTRKRGSTTIFHQSPQYEPWKSNTKSCTLLYTGKLGSGKSVLMANIVDDLHLVEGKDFVIAYFFCRHDLPASLKAQTILGSLARQLLRNISNLSHEANDETEGAWGVQEIFDLLSRVLPLDYKAFFVLDGLDECDPAEKGVLIENLKRLQQRFSLLLCISLRQEPTTSIELSSFALTSVTIASMPEENPDIEAYIQMELEQRIEFGKLALGDATLVLEIQDALLRGSQGMFLWVYLQIESLCEMRTDYDIREALSSLPRDLPEIFTRILQLAKSKAPKFQKRILELAYAALRPLTTEELREALSVVPGNAVWDATRLINDVYGTIACCGSVIVVDEEELTVRFVHGCVKQYLVERFQDTAQDSNLLPFSAAGAGKMMSDTVITYLNYGVFETQISTRAIAPMMIGSAPSNIIESTLIGSKSVQTLALKLLKSTKPANHDISKTLAQGRSSSRSRSRDEFRFYYYARTYWFQHLIRSPPSGPSMRELFKHLLESSVAKLDFGHQSNEAILHWAAQNGHDCIIKLVMENSNVKVNATDESEKTALLWAAANGHPSTVQVLLDSMVRMVDKTDKDDRTALSWAAANGHERVVEILIGPRFIMLDYGDNVGRTPLSWAAGNGHEGIVRLLLDSNFPELRLRDADERTPLTWAAANGHARIVSMLLGSRLTELNCKDRYGRTPLSWAAGHGHCESVRILLEHDPSTVDSADFTARSPLSWAAEYGHDEVVMVLLEFGKASAQMADNEGRRPAFYAEAHGHTDIATLLQPEISGQAGLRYLHNVRSNLNTSTTGPVYGQGVYERPFSGSLRPPLHG